LKTSLSNRTVICNDTVMIVGYPSICCSTRNLTLKNDTVNGCKVGMLILIFPSIYKFPTDFLSMIDKKNFTSSLYLQPTEFPQNCLDPELTQFAHCDCAVSKLSERASRRCPLRLCCGNSVTGKPIRFRIRVCNGASHPTLSWHCREPQNIETQNSVIGWEETAKVLYVDYKNYIKAGLTI
jgi:hypothetical protein